ncbi:MAG: chromosomal replication initiator protein DnaA [Fimbriimonadaceae bacterium]|nr:chromosomal replication initiator protein DnaA [Fimbriimonadaceae bacterium]QYK58400.1 MAG: chromosomal replication initiator protein DnaA [Fimbriimonadaceae bacterium]
MSDQFSLEEHPTTIAIKTVWDRVLHRLSESLPATVVLKFLRPLQPVELTEAAAVFDAPGQFVLEWVKEKYSDAIEAEFEVETGRPIRLELRSTPRERTAPSPTEASQVRHQPVSVEGVAAFNPSERYRFETFVTGQSNRLAFAGAKAVASAPGTKYNPLFIYGPTGLGKTHLMHAIAHEIQRGKSGLNVTYVSAQSFTEEFVHALQNNKIDAFRRAQRGVGVWLLDDVQFIAGKERTLEELFHTFNYLHNSGKQIVLCSDRPPRDLLLMDERLRSRFEAGLVCDVQLPDTELRCAIIQSKAKEEGLELPHDVAMYLAESIPSNVRILEGALTKLAVQASLEGSGLDRELAEVIVEKYYRMVGQAKPSFDQILEAVSKHYKIPTHEIKGTSRKAPVAHARHVAVYVTRTITGDSWKHIGALFGNRDHTSMMHGYKKIRGMMGIDKELNSAVQSMITDLYPTA